MMNDKASFDKEAQRHSLVRYYRQVLQTILERFFKKTAVEVKDGARGFDPASLSKL